MAGVKSISSYPYLNIAKKFDLDYSDVLIVGEFMTRGANGPRQVIAQASWNRLRDDLDSRPHEIGRYNFGLFLAEMSDARDNFKAIVEQGWDQS